ncbi:serine/arginine repetitive matrix protein 2-like [Boleophthalmus pectinirostris]|uniref:serine/arginine repetitive matrix protein 2-like n=1 Tax=Boleophthalmus pectinirostris TaxID=150288 RepID=UPI00242AAB39|nr:serine/arginine repetitive matrix protein 2-like [Boleophthalmus pectinirostris]
MNNFRGHSLCPSAASVGRERSQFEWDRYPQYSEYLIPSPGNRSTTGASSAWHRPGGSSQNCHKEEQEDDDDLDGQLYESDKEDPELARKRKELQEIQEQIMQKRAFLALKTIDFETVNPGLFSEEVRPTESTETLQGRVKLILMQRNRVIRSKSPVAKTRQNSINIQHDHPLKHRVKVALEQRFVIGLPVKTQHLEEIPFFSAPRPSQIDSSPAEEGEKGNQGFMRFLNILNKGVDIDRLKEVVIDDTDYFTQQPHKSQNGGEMHGETSTFSFPPESKSQNVGKMHGEMNTFSFPPESKNQNVGKMHGEMSTFSSPPEKKRQWKEEQPLPNPDEQQKHLQNILESLGLSLGTDEISKLADRTHERLYGKRQKKEEEDKKEDEPQQTEGEEKYSPAHYTRSSSSSSTSSLSSSPVSKTPSKQSLIGRRRSRSSSRKRRSRSSSRRRRSRSSSRRRRSRSSSRRRRSRSSSRRRRSRSSSRRRRSRSSSRRRRSRSSSRRRRSRSSCRRRRSVSPYRQRSPRSPCSNISPSSFPHHYRRSRSPYTRRNSNSPYRRQDSHSPSKLQSPHPRDRRDPLQLQAPSQPYPYPQSKYFNPHFPPQMYPDPYSQYTAYYNYWAYYHQNIPPLLPHQQTEPHTSNSSLLEPPPEDSESTSNESISEKDNLPNTSNTVKQTTRCLVTIKKMCLSETRKCMSKYQNAIPKQETKARTRKRCRGAVGAQMIQSVDPNVKNAQDWTKEINEVIAVIKQENYPNIFETAGMSGAPGITGAKKKKKKKKKKKHVFIERNEQMEKLLRDRPGPVTRVLAVKNPAKLAESGLELVDINDVEVPLTHLPLNVSVKMTVEGEIEPKKVKEEEEEKEKPVLTEEEIKANLKLKLEAFNSRIKKNPIQPAQLLMRQNIKVEDEI